MILQIVIFEDVAVWTRRETEALVSRGVQVVLALFIRVMLLQNQVMTFVSPNLP